MGPRTSHYYWVDEQPPYTFGIDLNILFYFRAYEFNIISNSSPEAFVSAKQDFVLTVIYDDYIGQVVIRELQSMLT